MQYPGGLVEGTNADAVAAIATVAGKPAEALFRVQWPAQYSFSVGDIDGSVGWLSIGNGLTGAVPGAFLTDCEKSQAPDSIGLSGTSGRLVKILFSRTLGPYCGVISSPSRPSSPNPASMARGILLAVSLPIGMAP